MSGKYILNAAGEPVEERNTLKWAAWFESRTTDRIVAKTTVGHYTVSTVFLGLDHQYGDGPPLLFETMVFGGGPLNNEMDRYPTKAAAQAGHDQMVAKVRDAITPASSPA